MVFLMSTYKKIFAYTDKIETVLDFVANYDKYTVSSKWAKHGTATGILSLENVDTMRMAVKDHGECFASLAELPKWGWKTITGGNTCLHMVQCVVFRDAPSVNSLPHGKPLPDEHRHPSIASCEDQMYDLHIRIHIPLYGIRVVSNVSGQTSDECCW